MVVNLTGETSVRQLAALLKQARVLVSGDSGPVHVASCVGTPVVAIFGSSIPGKSSRRWGPRSAGSVMVEKPRLEDISVEDVFIQVRSLLGR